MSWIICHGSRLLIVMFPHIRILLVKRNEDYIVFYSYEGSNSFKFNRQMSQYLTLDLILEGNADDELNTSFIHINKCALQINKNMYFNRSLNAVDLKFVVINDNNSYITLE